MITTKPTQLKFLDASMYIGVVLKYSCDIISKKKLRITVLSVEYLQWWVIFVLILEDRSHGGRRALSFVQCLCVEAKGFTNNFEVFKDGTSVV